MPPGDAASLRDYLGSPSHSSGRCIFAHDASVSLAELERGTSLGGDAQSLAGRSVLIATRDQLTATLALIELDGLARRMVLCPPDVDADHLPGVIENAEVDAIVSDRDPGEFAALGIGHVVRCSPKLASVEATAGHRGQTEWILFTSGTSGAPKLVQHSFAGLTAAIKLTAGRKAPVVWGTFYDIRRYGGLQIFLRAMLDGGSLVLSSAGEPVADHLARLAERCVTHISGTPSHWRRALMSPAACEISPEYVRLSGEIADQAILDNLHTLFPAARIGHAYASTEAGVGFEVDDGREGFPAGYIGRRGDVEMDVADGALRLRSPRTASRYVGNGMPALADADGYVDTGDMVELRGDRYHFVGRRGGIINVGGLKVHPEEVEAVINRHPEVRMSLVRPRRSPVTGAIVVADVVLRDESHADRCGELRREIIAQCRHTLAPHKVPATIAFVPALAVAATGKLTRRHA